MIKTFTFNWAIFGIRVFIIKVDSEKRLDTTPTQCHAASMIRLPKIRKISLLFSGCFVVDQRQARGREGGFILTDQREAGKHHCFIFLPIYCEHCKLLPKKIFGSKRYI